MAEKYKVSEAQIVLKWLFNHAANILLIPGTSSVEHLEENMKASAIEIEKSDFEEMSDSFEKNASIK